MRGMNGVLSQQAARPTSFPISEPCMWFDAGWWNAQLDNFGVRENGSYRPICCRDGRLRRDLPFVQPACALGG
jgi:hypothetical protein